MSVAQESPSRTRPPRLLPDPPVLRKSGSAQVAPFLPLALCSQAGPPAGAQLDTSDAEFLVISEVLGSVCVAGSGQKLPSCLLGSMYCRLGF